MPKTEKTFNKPEYDAQYQKEHYYRVSATLAKADRARIEAAAEKAGITKAAYIKRAILDMVERDGF